MVITDPRTGYAPVNGLQMYYEIHGESRDDGSPLVLLHGAYMTTGLWGPLLPALAATRQVIAVDLQAHGRTNDADRPITYEGMADDTAALLRHLEIGRANVLGYSMGGGVAIQLAIRHPDLVCKLVPVSASFSSAGGHPEMFAMIETITPELFAGSPFEATYLEVAPNPGDFPQLVEKLKTLDLTPFDWQDDFGDIAAPTLIVVGDSDATRLEHAVEMFRLLGGGVMGDLAGLPRSQLAILPGTAHFIPPGSGMLDRADWLLPMVIAFLDAPIPEEGSDS